MSNQATLEKMVFDFREDILWEDPVSLFDPGYQHRYYDIIRALPSAGGCDAKLVLKDSEHLCDRGMALSGEYNPMDNTIILGPDLNPYEVIGTIVHEVAHWSANERRHGRPHGYVWRRIYAKMTEELIGFHPASMAEGIRRAWRMEPGGFYEPKSTALDAAVVALLTINLKMCL